MDDAGIRRRLNAIIVLQVLLLVLALPGGPGVAVVIGMLLALLVAAWATISVLERNP